MTDQQESTAFYEKRTYRVLTATFGVILLGVGVYALLAAGPLTLFSLLGGLGVVLLGGNMVVSAYAARDSWLSKIGPLP